jgi:hypothetical protein
VPVRTPFALVAVGLLTAALTTSLVGAAPAGAGPGGASSSSETAPRAATAVTLGQAGGTLAVCNGTVPSALVLDAAGAGTPSYTAPSAGVLTSFTTVTNNKTGQVRAVVLGPGTTPDRLLVAAKGPKQTVQLSRSNTFPLRLRIQAGQKIALGYTASGMACASSGVAGDVSKAAAPFDPDTTNDFVYSTTLSGFRPNISAVLEPDADTDGYGDISQDACPQSALTQVTCPAPETTLTKQPKKHSKRARIKVKFTSTVAGSTFQCSRDGHKFKPCHSPYKRRFGPGHHKLLIRAVTPAGIKDRTPAKVKFTIR